MLTIDEIKAAVTKVGKSTILSLPIFFGSYAKNDADEASDVGPYVDSGLRGLHFVGLIESLRAALGRDVDVLDSTHIDNRSKVKSEIVKTRVLLYER